MSNHLLTLHNDIGEIDRLHEFVDGICENYGVDAGEAMQLNLALEEAVSNVMLYAFPHDEVHSFELTCEAEADGLTFEIVDDGIPFDPTAQDNPDVTLSAEERAIGGLGIYMVRQIMDEVHYEWRDGKNRLKMAKRLAINN